MNTLFQANRRLKEDVVKRQKKYSRAWRLQLPIRIILWLCLPVGIYAMNYYMPEMDTFMLVILVLLIWSLIAVNYFIISSIYVVLQVRKKEESLELEEEEIVYRYKPFNVGHSRRPLYRVRFLQYTETRVRYQNIKRIEYYPHYQAVKVYAPFEYTVYRDYRTLNVKKKGSMKGTDEFRLYYEYFDHFGDFLQAISEKSGVSVTRVDTIGTFKGEKQIK